MRILELIFFSFSVFVIITMRKFIHNSNNTLVKGFITVDETIKFIQFSAFVLITIVVFGLAIAASKNTSFHLL